MAAMSGLKVSAFAGSSRTEFANARVTRMAGTCVRRPGHLEQASRCHHPTRGFATGSVLVESGVLGIDQRATVRMMTEKSGNTQRMKSKTVGRSDKKGKYTRSSLPRVQSIGRGFTVLFAIAKSETGLRAKEIIELTGLNRQTAYHIIHSLNAVGVITKNRESKYVLGLKVAGLVDGFKRHLAPPELLAPLIREVAQRTGETAYAVGWSEGEIIAIATARGSAAVSATEVPHGYYGNAHARASGKLLLALASPLDRENYFRVHKLDALTPQTICDRSRLEDEFKRIRRDGFAVDKEEFVAGLCCMAVPVGGANSGFAIAISAPVDRFNSTRKSHLRIMREVAEATGGWT